MLLILLFSIAFAPVGSGVGIERKHDVTIRRLHDPGRIPCKRGGGRSSTKANRLNIGCCRLRGRPRAIRPAPPGGYLSFDRARRCGAIADDFAADGTMQTFNP